MKTLLLSVTALATLCLSFSKTKTFVPPGTAQVNDSLFADKTEISNFAWQEYEQSIKTQYGANSKEHLATLPDTLVWREKLSYNEPYVDYYYRHPAYKDFPVVGVSYEQAVAYCAWRTQQVKTKLSGSRDFKHRNFEYRLPSKKEWEALAETSVNVLFNNGKNREGDYELNCAMDEAAWQKRKAQGADVVTSVYSYKANSLKLYNMLGNVAEMVSEKGICKGGGWKNMVDECRPGKDAGYTKPTAWIGFRCVCVVRKG